MMHYYQSGCSMIWLDYKIIIKIPWFWFTFIIQAQADLSYPVNVFFLEWVAANIQLYFFVFVWLSPYLPYSYHYFTQKMNTILCQFSFVLPAFHVRKYWHVIAQLLPILSLQFKTIIAHHAHNLNLFFAK